MRLQQTLAPRAEAGAGRTQVRWYPTHEYQRDPPSTLLAPTLPLDGEEKKRNGKLTGLPLLTAAVISTRPLRGAAPNETFTFTLNRKRGRVPCSKMLGPGLGRPPLSPFILFLSLQPSSLFFAPSCPCASFLLPRFHLLPFHFGGGGCH